MVKFNNILSYILGGVFIFSSFSKAISISGFGMVVDTFMSLLGLDVFYGHGIVIGWVICLVELVLGAMMYPKVLRKIAIGCITAMLMVFTYITYINITSLYGGIESCGCFGEIIHFTASQTFYKNIVLLALSCYLLMVTVVKPMRMLACFFSLLFLSSCMDSEKVRQTITRQHVLAHYRFVERDTLKYQAAEFLLDNMKYHTSREEIVTVPAELEEYVI